MEALQSIATVRSHQIVPEVIDRAFHLIEDWSLANTPHMAAKMSHVLPQHTLTTFTSSASSVVFSPTIQNNEVTSGTTEICWQRPQHGRF